MAIEDLRFPQRKMVVNMIRACELTGAVITEDDAGWYAHSFTMPAWLAAMPEKTQTAFGTPAVAKPKATRAPKGDGGGTCAAIRAWAIANPEATKADGIAQFPGFNPSTIQIQMRKARMGRV